MRDIIIYEILIPALNKLYHTNYDNIHFGVSERNVCARLAHHMENIMRSYDNRNHKSLMKQEPVPVFVSYRDVLVNIVGFIPVGVLVGMLSRRHRVAKALLAGVMISLAIEGSQLIWKKGVFDVDDIFNNAVGAVIGGGIVLVSYRSIRRARFNRCNYDITSHGLTETRNGE